jgi:hypothetical protein
VNQAKANFNDARIQSERWVQAVTLPLETQMKEHKQQLQTRLEHLTKINEKSTGIKDKLAELDTLAKSLAEQRQMIEGLIERVSQGEVTAGEVPRPSLPGRPCGAGGDDRELPRDHDPHAGRVAADITTRRGRRGIPEVAHVKGGAAAPGEAGAASEAGAARGPAVAAARRAGRSDDFGRHAVRVSAPRRQEG